MADELFGPAAGWAEPGNRSGPQALLDAAAGAPLYPVASVAYRAALDDGWAALAPLRRNTPTVAPQRGQQWSWATARRTTRP